MGRAINRAFFDDLDKLDRTEAVFIFFDQFEKADRRFQDWLMKEFIERLEEKALVAVIAGHENLESTRQYDWVQYFTPKIDEIDHFYSYAESCGVQVDPP